MLQLLPPSTRAHVHAPPSPARDQDGAMGGMGKKAPTRLLIRITKRGTGTVMGS